MHLLFVDEPGTPPKPGADSPKYFVVGGIIIPEGVWHRVRGAMLGLKIRHRIRGEIKWRYFAPDNDDGRNPMKDLPHEARNAIRADIIRIITSEASVKALGCVCSAAAAYETAAINTQEELYHGTYKPVTERFQYYLQDLSRAVGATQLGIVVADHRGNQDDKRLRGHHQKSSTQRGSSYRGTTISSKAFFWNRRTLALEFSLQTWLPARSGGNTSAATVLGMICSNHPSDETRRAPSMGMASSSSRRKTGDERRTPGGAVAPAH